MVEARDKQSREHVAIKFIARGSKITRYVEHELINHKVLRHPHIVKFKEVFLTNLYLAIVMEYAAGGDILDYVLQRG